MKKVLKSIFSSEGALSSKRIFGGIGFIIYLIMFCVSKTPPDSTIAFISASLLGLDTMLKGFTNKVTDASSDAPKIL